MRVFHTETFAYKIKLENLLSPSQHFKDRALKYSQMYTSDLNIAMQIVISNTLTAGILNKNIKQTVKYFFTPDRIYSLMPSIEDTST